MKNILSYLIIPSLPDLNASKTSDKRIFYYGWLHSMETIPEKILGFQYLAVRK